MSIHRRQAKSGVRGTSRLRRPDGAAYSRTFRTKAEAERFQATELADRARGAWLDPTAGQVLVAAWAEEWYESSAHTWRPRTAAAHRLALDNHWLPPFGHFRMVEVTPRLVQQAINQMAQRYKPSSIRTYFATLRGLMADAVDADVVGRTPCRGIKLPPSGQTRSGLLRPKSFTAWPTPWGSGGGSWSISVGSWGLRFGEAIALRPEDMDLDGAELSVSRTVVS